MLFFLSLIVLPRPGIVIAAVPGRACRKLRWEVEC